MLAVLYNLVAEAEVDDLNFQAVVILVNHDVLRLQIAVDVALFVNAVQAHRQLDRELGNRLQIEHQNLVHLVLQRVAELLHRHRVEPRLAHELLSINVARVLIDLVVVDGARNSNLGDLVLNLDFVEELLWLAHHSFNLDYFFRLILAKVDTAVST